MNASFLGLVQNATFLLAVAFLFDVAASRWRVSQSSFWKVLVGLALGAIGITVMLTPWTFGLGIVFDTRSILLGISGLFFGFFPTTIAMAMTAAFRFYQGGTGAWTGIAVILASGAIGIAWRHFRCRHLAEISWQELYLFGMVIHLTMLSLMFSLPWATALRVLSNIALPVLVIYPLGTALLGVLMVNRLQRESMEETLRKSEEKYRWVVDNMADVITVIDMNLRFTYVSPSIMRLRGYTAEEATAQTFEQVMTPESLQIIAKVFEEEMELEASGKADPGRSRILELQQYRKDGSIVWMENNLSFIRDETQKPVSIISLSRDITDRKRAEEALKESENKYRLLADNVNDVIFVLDMNLNYTYISPSVKFLRGYEPEEVLKQSSIEKTLTPPSLELAMTTYSEIMDLEKSGHREISESRTLQLEMWRKDGTTVWTEVKFSFIRDEYQRPVGLLGLTRDMTDRKQAEKALRESEALFRKLFEDHAAVKLIIDPDTGSLVDANEAASQYYGWPRERLKEMKITEINTLTPEEIKKEMERAVANKRTHFEFRHRLSNGSIRDVTVFSSRIENKGKVLLHSIVHDITERKRAEEKLQETLASLRKAYGTTIQVMVSAVESRDPYTAGHQVRSANLARAIATEMGLSQDTIEAIRMAGPIHDIGKLSVPAEILSKPTKLTNLEFSLIKEHAQTGYEMLKDVESPWPLAEIVYQHHERMDGSGYPRKLKGDEILMEARIMAVADVVEAMASHRPYRPALGLNVALEEIEKNKGIFYDNTVADACLRLFREKGFQLEGA
jgi:PAS domain S-box-containing protein/putative nucleotidyltransferase with HDIG domain